MKKKRILIFEDEPAIAENLVYALESEGFETQRAATAEEGLMLFAKEAPDLVILDVGLPDRSGFEVCKQLRANHGTPIFFLTARGSEIDRVVGLEIGADDYIVKPFSPREVSARVRAIFRRLEGRSVGDASPLKKPRDLLVDEAKRRILYQERELNLSPHEYRLLKALLRTPGRVYSRTELMELAWDEPEMSLERTIDSHIKSIRAKLSEIDPSGAALIETHRGFGYSVKA